jgi:prepilin-type N-terminal cleavage/methylation domain-containing protein
MLEMKKIKAFTLVELLVTITVLVILAMIAAPSMSRILHNFKVNSSSGDVLNFLQQARTEAVKLGKTVTVCASNDGVNCITSNQSNWSAGIIAKTDTTTLQKLAFDNSLLVVTAPESIAFNTVGSTNDEYEITVAISGATTHSVCVEVIGRAFKSKTGC